MAESNLMTQTPAVCTNCEEVYTARKLDDDTLLVPTEDGACQCGSEAFREIRLAA